MENNSHVWNHQPEIYSAIAGACRASTSTSAALLAACSRLLGNSRNSSVDVESGDIDEVTYHMGDKLVKHGKTIKWGICFKKHKLVQFLGDGLWQWVKISSPWNVRSFCLGFPNLLDKRIVAGAFHTGFSKWLTRYSIFTVLNISNRCWLNHILDGWNPISNGMFTTYQLWISPLRTWSARASHEGASSSTSSSTFVAPSKRHVSPVAVIIVFFNSWFQ